MSETEEYYEFKYYEEWSQGFRGKGQRTWLRLHMGLENESWFFNLSFAEKGMFLHLAILSLRTCNRIPTSKMWLKASCSQHGGISLSSTLNKFEYLGVFVRKKCTLEEKRKNAARKEARSGFVGPKTDDEKRKEIERQRRQLAQKFSI